MENVDFLVVQTPSDTPSCQTGSGSNTPMTNHSSAASTPSVHLAPGQISLAQTGRGTNVVSIFTAVCLWVTGYLGMCNFTAQTPQWMPICL